MDPKKGDRFLLFEKLPYDFHSGTLPIKIVPGLYLADTPHHVLSTASHPCYVLPTYTYPWITHICFLSPADEVVYLSGSGDSPFFNLVAAMRLFAPVKIDISGSFEVGDLADPEDAILNPCLYWRESPWQPRSTAEYSAHDANIWRDIFKRYVQASNKKYPRLRLAITLFSQVTSGFSCSYQMCHLALFSALEALFVAPKEPKRKTLGGRVSQFLRAFDAGDKIGERLKDEYKNGRCGLAHGNWEMSVSAVQSEERNQAFGFLHEITRLSILGFLSMTEEQWEELYCTGKKLQRQLDALRPASGALLDGQEMWT